MVPNEDSPYRRLINGASAMYVGHIVNSCGTVSVLNVRLAGIVRVVSTTPGRMPPHGEPTPGKIDPPLPPVAEPSLLVNGGAIALPVRPKFGPGPPTKGNCTNG